VTALIWNILLLGLSCSACITWLKAFSLEHPSEFLSHLPCHIFARMTKTVMSLLNRDTGPCQCNPSNLSISPDVRNYNIPFGVGIVISNSNFLPSLSSQIPLSFPPRIHPWVVILVRLKWLNCPVGRYTTLVIIVRPNLSLFLSHSIPLSLPTSCAFLAIPCSLLWKLDQLPPRACGNHAHVP
jgi:hypothetical protein